MKYKLKYSDLKWPAGLNLDFLSSLLSDKMMDEIIQQYADRPRKERRIILPSRSTVRKVVAHFYGSQVAQGKLTWPEAMKILKGGFKKLADLGLSRKMVKQFYLQREKEIRREK